MLLNGFSLNLQILFPALGLKYSIAICVLLLSNHFDSTWKSHQVQQLTYIDERREAFYIPSTWQILIIQRVIDVSSIFINA
jgi:hypothetical protein